MYQIAICEDEQVFSDKYKKICRATLEKLNIEHQISVFASGEDFLAVFTARQKRYDLILLDIVMGSMDGITLAREIRLADKDVVIIFITSSQDYVFKGYDVSARHYLMKPVDTRKLENLITEAYTEKYCENNYIFKFGEQHLCVPLKDIVCIETVGRRVEVSLMDKSFYHSGKLSEVFNELPEKSFVRCHQSFVVNLENIRELTRQNVIAVNGKKIPVSRTYLDDTRKAFLRRMGDE